MIRSMYSAVSGLRSHQVMMDVVGNNIANVNTHGYKRSQTIFHDVLSQNLRGAAAPTPTVGGRNPAQVGLGVAVGATSQNLSQGFLQVTNRDLDVSIQGDGFFVVDDAGEQLYTRSGSFFLDEEGRLVSSEGALVQGWTADIEGNFDPAAAYDAIRIPIGGQNPPVVTTTAKFGGNLPATAPIGEQVFAGLQVFDNVGASIPLNLQFEKTAVDEWTVTATYGDPPTAIPLTDNVINFVAGEVTTPADLDMNIAAGGIPGLGAVSLQIGGDGDRRVTQFGDAISVSAVTEDGAAAGVLQSARVGSDGIIRGSYSNGKTQAIARIALANFANPEGLERSAGSTWRQSANSGLAQVGTTGTAGRGTVAPGALEMSNVDLAGEFTSLIQAQRGFQANSRVVSSSDELLQEIVNLVR